MCLLSYLKMKSYTKREKKKYPYNRFKQGIFAKIRARERRIKEKLDQYAIIDENGKVIEKYRIRQTAENEIKRFRKDYFEELKIVELDEYGKPVVTNKR